MHVLFTSTSGHGHFQPLVPYIRACRELGHDVTIVAPTKLAATVAATGAAYVPCEGPPPDRAGEFWARVEALPRGESSKLIEQEWFGGLCLDAMMPVVTLAVNERTPDLIVRETCEYAAAIVADRAGIDHWQVGVSTSKAESSVLQHYVADILNQYGEGLAHRLFECPYLTKFPTSLDPEIYPHTIRVREDSNSPTDVFDGRWRGATTPLIYVTLGTVAMRNEGGRKLLKSIVDAIAPMAVRMLVTTGSPETIDMGDVPDNVRIAPWVEQASVLASVSAVVCHGGSGTVFGSLGAGVPLVILPMFADQPTNACLVVEAGAGLSLGTGERSLEENVADLVARIDELAPALERVLVDDSYREAARRVEGEMLTMMTPTTVIDQFRQRQNAPR